MTARSSMYSRGNSRRSHQSPGNHPSGKRHQPRPPVEPANHDRTVLVIADLQELQHVANPNQPYAHYYRMLAPRYYTTCGATLSLFSWSCLVPPRQLPHPFRQSIVTYIQDTFLLDLDPSDIELSYCDMETYVAHPSSRVLHRDSCTG